MMRLPSAAATARRNGVSLRRSSVISKITNTAASSPGAKEEIMTAAIVGWAHSQFGKLFR